MRLKSICVALPVLLGSLGLVSVASADTSVVKAQVVTTPFRIGDRVDVVIPPVPAPRVEVIPARPSADHFWVAGYWHWHPVERHYVWVPGEWHARYAPSAPPAVRVENPGVAPSANHFWAHGYWKWSGAGYEWRAGHWDVIRSGFEYVHPHWEVREGRWAFVEGAWRRR